MMVNLSTTSSSSQVTSSSSSSLFPEWDSQRGVWVGSSPFFSFPLLSSFDASDVWVFGYGSLCWKAEDLKFEEKFDGFIEDYVRGFYQKSMDHRGIPSSPGLVVTALSLEEFEEQRQMAAAAAVATGTFLSLNELTDEKKMGLNDDTDEKKNFESLPLPPPPPPPCFSGHSLPTIVNSSSFSSSSSSSSSCLSFSSTSVHKVFGVAYKISPQAVQEVINNLNFREKGGYSHEFVKVHRNSCYRGRGDEKEKFNDKNSSTLLSSSSSSFPRSKCECGGVSMALLYRGTPANPNFQFFSDVNAEEVEEAAKQIFESVGPSGSNLQYFLCLQKYMETIGERDEHIERLGLELKRLEALKSEEEKKDTAM